MCEVAVTFIALGANIQRYGLTVVAPERKIGCFKTSNLVWFGGLVTYFFGNVVFFGALSLAPASLCGALLPTVVVLNPIIARILLKEEMKRCDYHGCALVTGGMVLIACYAPYVTILHDAHDLATLFTDVYGALYTGFLVLLAFILAMLIFRFERLGKLRSDPVSPKQAYLAGEVVPRTRPCSAGPAEAASLEMTPSKGTSSCSGGASGGGGKQAAGGSGVASFEVSCTVLPSSSSSASAAAASEKPQPQKAKAADDGEGVLVSRPSSDSVSLASRASSDSVMSRADSLTYGSSPPPSPPSPPKEVSPTTGPIADLGARSWTGPATAPATPLAPSLRDAKTTVAGGGKQKAVSHAVADQPSPLSVGKGFAGGDPIGRNGSMKLTGRQKKGWLSQLMNFAYPLVLGIIETLVQVDQKAASSMLFLTLEGQNQLCSSTFWGTVGILVILCLLQVWWLRKGVANLPVTRLLPIEYGTVSSTSIIAALVIYQERQYVSNTHILFMMVGIVLIAIGCGLVGRRKTIKKYLDPVRKITHDYLPRVQNQIREIQRQTGLHAQHQRYTTSRQPMVGS